MIFGKEMERKKFRRGCLHFHVLDLFDSDLEKVIA